MHHQGSENVKKSTSQRQKIQSIAQKSKQSNVDMHENWLNAKNIYMKAHRRNMIS